MEFLMVFLYYLFNVHVISSNDLSYISDISNSCPLFHFFVSLARGLSVLVILSKKQL